MLVGVSLLAISLSILFYHYPPSSWSTRFYATEDPAGGAKSRDDELNKKQETPSQSPKDAEQSESSPSPQTTPKAVPISTGREDAVPTFALDPDDDSDDDEDNLPPPSFPALNSAQRASGPSSSLPAVSNSQPSSLSKPSLMAPPARPASSSLMPPPTRALPSNLRALPTQSASMRTPNARGKVQLSPGHSPLDWANLQKSDKDLSGVGSLIRVTPSMLKEKNGRKGRPAWSSYQGKVYNISPYLPYHPGGEGELRRAAGKNGEKLFMEAHPWVNWENMLGECLVGVMVSEEATGPSLEDMD
ncbi:hypothetical protein BDV96DRAFT_502238 [Lophiotrema nucula]|uniref:Cytochrome b5 heme-binding domain-containing protein n=1 Tax=Lophiotrema nucula TaxID=690887 RepID=A0A6A5YS97_9PLEO|nr:hypothetical protein BDV96DRAFT_502238 [Lophiotrema nucula]